MDTDRPNAADAATADFGLRREAKRHAAFGNNRSYEKRCRCCALPPQFKSLSSGHEVAGLYYGWQGSSLHARAVLTSIQAISSAQHPLNPASATLWMFRQFTLPNPHHPPACPAQRPVHQPVALFIPGQFLFPESAVIRRFRRVSGTAMPETAVHEECEPHLPENKIRFHS